MNGTLNVIEAAKLMKVHRETVYDLINSGALRAGKVGRSYVLLEDDVMKFIEQVIISQTMIRMGVSKRRAKSAKNGRTD